MWKLKVKEQNFYISYLQILNGILKLTKTELSVLAQFMEIKNSLITTKLYAYTTFSTENRKYVQDRLNITQHNLNNFIKSLKEKKMIVNEDINEKIFILRKHGAEISFRIEYDKLLSDVSNS